MIFIKGVVNLILPGDIYHIAGPNRSFPCLRKLSISANQIEMLSDATLYPLLTVLSISESEESAYNRLNLTSIAPQILALQILMFTGSPTLQLVLPMFSNLQHLSINSTNEDTTILDKMKVKLKSIQLSLRDDFGESFEDSFIDFEATISSSNAKFLSKLSAIYIAGADKGDVFRAGLDEEWSRDEGQLISYKIRVQGMDLEVNWDHSRIGVNDWKQNLDFFKRIEVCVFLRLTHHRRSSFLC